MKNLFIILFTILASFFLTACSTNMHYQPKMISKNIKSNLPKVNNVEIQVVSPDKVIKKSPESFRGRLSSLDIQVGEINRKVAQKFFSQYFQTVKASKKILSNSEIIVKSEVLDYSYKYGFSDSTDMTIIVKVEFIIKGKKVFNKTYKITDNNKVFLTFSSLSLKDGTMELFHKELLKLYTTKIKKDLVKVVNLYY